MALTTDRCSRIIQLLERRGWTIARMARAIGRPTEYVRRIKRRKQSFQLGDVELLAKACKTRPYRLVFDSIQRGKLPVEVQGLYDLGLREVESHEEFVRVLNRKTTKKRRPRTKAA